MFRFTLILCTELKLYSVQQRLQDKFSLILANLDQLATAEFSFLHLAPVDFFCLYTNRGKGRVIDSPFPLSCFDFLHEMLIFILFLSTELKLYSVQQRLQDKL